MNLDLLYFEIHTETVFNVCSVTLNSICIKKLTNKKIYKEH